MTLLDRIALSIALDLDDPDNFPADYLDFRERVDALVPDALYWIAPDDSTLVEEWNEAGRPGSEFPTSLSLIRAIRHRLENFIIANLDSWDVLDDLTGFLSASTRREISDTRVSGPEGFFNLLAPHFRTCEPVPKGASSEGGVSLSK